MNRTTIAIILIVASIALASAAVVQFNRYNKATA